MLNGSKIMKKLKELKQNYKVGKELWKTLYIL